MRCLLLLLLVLLPVFSVAAPSFFIPGVQNVISSVVSAVQSKLDRVQHFFNPPPAHPPVFRPPPQRPGPPPPPPPPPPQFQSFPEPRPLPPQPPPPGFQSSGPFSPPQNAAPLPDFIMPAETNNAPPVPEASTPSLIVPQATQSTVDKVVDNSILVSDIVTPKNALVLETESSKRSERSCSPREIHGQLGSKKYYFSWNDPSTKPRKSWAQVEELCRAKCMQPLTLVSAEENRLLKLKMNRDGVAEAWTGGTRKASDWIWVSTGSEITSTFQDWAQGEPDISQPCLKLKINLSQSANQSSWHSSNCQAELPFVCEA